MFRDTNSNTARRREYPEAVFIQSSKHLLDVRPDAWLYLTYEDNLHFQYRLNFCVWVGIVMVPEFDAQEINSFKMGPPRSPKRILIDNSSVKCFSRC